jgi:hypothetical protein
MWLHRRTEEPSPTSTVCYWKRSVLSTVKDQGTFLKVSQMKKPKQPLRTKDDLSENVLAAFLKEEPEHCQLYLHFSDVDSKKGSIHSLISYPILSYPGHSSTDSIRYLKRTT